MKAFREYIPEGGWYNWNMRQAARQRRKLWIKDTLRSIGLALVLLAAYTGVGLVETYL